MEKNQSPAFKDFKNAISNEEFLAVLEVAKEEHAKLSKAMTARQKFFDQAANGMITGIQQGEDGSSQGLPPGLAEKLVEGLKRRADKDMSDIFQDEAKRHVALTEFVNRFTNTNEQLEVFDLSFITKKN